MLNESQPFAGLNWHFVFAYVNWICEESVQSITVEFTIPEVTELLQLMTEEGSIIQYEIEDGEADQGDKNAFDTYGTIFEKILTVLRENGLSVRAMLVEDTHQT